MNREQVHILRNNISGDTKPIDDLVETLEHAWSDVDRLKQDNDELKFMLRRLEFMFYAQKGSTIIKICPICKCQEYRQHKDDCELKQLLQEVSD